MFLCGNQWNVFNTLTLKHSFLGNENLFQKTGVPFLVETTEIENTSFPFKTALSETNVKANRMATKKWTYHKEWIFSSNYFIFLDFFFSVLEPLKKSEFDVPATQVFLFAFFVSSGV